MSRETKPTDRLKPTLSSVDISSNGQKAIYRLTANNTVNSAEAPSWARFVLLRNDSGTDGIVFNFDGSTTHYYTLNPGEGLPSPIPIINGESLYYKSKGANAKLEVIIWG